MTIFNYSNLPTITVPYILRDTDNQSVGVWVTNQETKETGEDLKKKDPKYIVKKIKVFIINATKIAEEIGYTTSDLIWVEHNQQK